MKIILLLLITMMIILLTSHLKKAIEKLDYPISVIAYETNKQLNFSLKYAGELFESNIMEGLL